MLIAADVRAYICRDPVDMRKSINTLSYLVEPLLAQKPASGDLFVFVGRDRTKVKCLYWDRTGFALWYKRLEHKDSGLKFVTPVQRHNGVATAVLAQREAVYAEARQRNPRRWSRSTRNWKLKDEVWLNPERMQPEELKQSA